MPSVVALSVVDHSMCPADQCACCCGAWAVGVILCIQMGSEIKTHQILTFNSMHCLAMGIVLGVPMRCGCVLVRSKTTVRATRWDCIPKSQ
eukprot:15444804-Alexandrium_andersonii.AAC.1